MKKSIYFLFLLLSAIGNAQTFGIYTENTNITSGVNSLRFSNGQGFSASEPTTAPYEGAKNYQFSYNGTSGYFHAILFPRNAANTADTTVDLSAFSYYNVSIKTSSPHPFYIRIRGNNVIAKVLINPASNSYSFTNDNLWHPMSIPISAFVPESSAFSLAVISEIFVLRSENSIPTVAGASNDFQVDNIYASANQVLAIKEEMKTSFKIYPNPSSSEITVTSEKVINSISIQNAAGQEVIILKPKENKSTFDISRLNNGLYIIAVESDQKIVTSKFIKK